MPGRSASRPRAPSSIARATAASRPACRRSEPELFGLAAAMKRAGRGVIEVNSDFGDGEFDILRAAAAAAGTAAVGAAAAGEQRTGAVA